MGGVAVVERSVESDQVEAHRLVRPYGGSVGVLRFQPQVPCSVGLAAGYDALDQRAPDAPATVGGVDVEVAQELASVSQLVRGRGEPENALAIEDDVSLGPEPVGSGHLRKESVVLRDGG